LLSLRENTIKEKSYIKIRSPLHYLCCFEKYEHLEFLFRSGLYIEEDVKEELKDFHYANIRNKILDLCNSFGFSVKPAITH
jgi:ankyrin repeat protein